MSRRDCRTRSSASSNALSRESTSASISAGPKRPAMEFITSGWFPPSLRKKCVCAAVAGEGSEGSVVCVSATAVVFASGPGSVDASFEKCGREDVDASAFCDGSAAIFCDGSAAIFCDGSAAIATASVVGASAAFAAGSAGARSNASRTGVPGGRNSEVLAAMSTLLDRSRFVSTGSSVRSSARAASRLRRVTSAAAAAAAEPTAAAAAAGRGSRERPRGSRRGAWG